MSGLAFLIPAAVGVLGWAGIIAYLILVVDKRRLKAQSDGGRDGEDRARMLSAKQASLTEFAFLVAVIGVLLSSLWWAGPEGIEQIRVFGAQRVVIINH